jgi:hypothetical protein
VELDELQGRLDAQAQAQRDEASTRQVAQQQEVQALHDQLESVRKEVELAKGATERAQSEARGHQAGKLQLQKELDTLRGELTQAKASLAESGVQAVAIADTELTAVQARAQGAEERAARADEARAALEAELAEAKERQIGLEAELSATRGAASGKGGELEAALAGRRQAEDLLVKMRARYGELETQLQNEVPQLRDQLNEALAEKQMLDAERERLATQIERLEATRTQGADSERELKNRIDMLQRRVNAQDAELNALRRRAGILPGGAGVGGPVAPTNPAGPSAIGRVALAKSSAPTAPMKGVPLGGVETDVSTVRQAKPSAPRPGAAAPGPSRPPTNVPRPSPNAPRPTPKVTPVMTPLAAEPVTKPGFPRPSDMAASKTAAKTNEDVELEVFELELDENGDEEELLLLDEEASDPGPGTKKP